MHGSPASWTVSGVKRLRRDFRPRECAALLLGDLKKLLAILDRETLIGKRRCLDAHRLHGSDAPQ
jgi:hypothetical protein